MKNFQEVPYPIIPELCVSPDHYFNLIVDGKCFSCGVAWGLKPTEEMMEALDDEQMKHREAPSDAELEDMFALAGSDSENCRTAHD